MEYEFVANKFIQEVATEIDYAFRHINYEKGIISRSKDPFKWYSQRVIKLLPGVMIFINYGERVINETMSLNVYGKDAIVLSYFGTGVRYWVAKKNYVQHNRLYFSTLNENVVERSIFGTGEHINFAFAIDSEGLDKLTELNVFDLPTLKQLSKLTKSGTFEGEGIYTSARSIQISNQLFSQLKSPQRNILMFSSCIYDLLDSTLQDLNRSVLGNTSSQQQSGIDINGCKQFIENSSFMDVTVAQLAEYFNCHPSSLTRKFKQQYGENLSQFLQSRKMAWAKTLIIKDHKSPLEVAMLIGYKDLSSFSRAFSTYYGHPPSYYRKRML